MKCVYMHPVIFSQQPHQTRVIRINPHESFRCDKRFFLFRRFFGKPINKQLLCVIAKWNVTLLCVFFFSFLFHSFLFLSCFLFFRSPSWKFVCNACAWVQTRERTHRVFPVWATCARVTRRLHASAFSRRPADFVSPFDRYSRAKYTSC